MTAKGEAGATAITRELLSLFPRPWEEEEETLATEY
jgi:hypothetical protein